MKHIILLTKTLLLSLIPALGFSQFNILDKLEFYADLSPFQIKNNFHAKSKIAYSVTANYNIARFVGVGIGLNSNAGYESPWVTFDNLRQTSIFIGARPKFNIGKNQIFCFGNIGLPIKGDKTIVVAPTWIDPNTEIKADLFYAAGIGYARKIFGRFGVQVNYKWANISVSNTQMLAAIEEDGQHILSIGVVF